MTEYQGIRFDDSDIVNLDDAIWAGVYNPDNIRPFLLHNYGTVVAVVFARGINDTWVIARNCDRLDRYLINGPYGKVFKPGLLGIIELPIPLLSFSACFKAVEAAHYSQKRMY